MKSLTKKKALALKNAFWHSLICRREIPQNRPISGQRKRKMEIKIEVPAYTPEMVEAQPVTSGDKGFKVGFQAIDVTDENGVRYRGGCNLWAVTPGFIEAAKVAKAAGKTLKASDYAARAAKAAKA